MPAPATTLDLTALLKKTNLHSDQVIDDYVANHPGIESPPELLAAMQADNLLTPFQAGQILKGRHKGFILGKYRLLDRIGMGGMGQVYLAEHSTMRRRVAVKVLPPDRSDNPFSRERFLREARAAALLEHPNLVRAYDLETDDGVTYIVMDYIEGTTLHDLVMRRGPQPVVRVAHLLKMSAMGLSCVHERSLVHRDIKPANLLMDKLGVVRILDLGLVRSELDDDALTRGEGAKVVGTADYLAPEQAVSSSHVDGRADMYSLGCTAYFLLTGEPPFKAEKLSQKLIAHQVSEVKPVHHMRTDVPVEFSAIVSKLLSKRPEDRHQNCAALLAALEPWTREPYAAPTPEDFPSRNEAVYGPSSMGLSLSSRISLGNITGLSGDSSRSGRNAKPSGQTSDVRLAPDFAKPTDSQAAIQTVANGVAGAETMKNTPRPPLPATPSPLTNAPMALPDAKLSAKKDSFMKVAEMFGTKTATPVKVGGGNWKMAALLIAATAALVAAGVAVMTLR